MRLMLVCATLAVSGCAGSLLDPTYPFLLQYLAETHGPVEWRRPSLPTEVAALPSPLPLPTNADTPLGLPFDEAEPLPGTVYEAAAFSFEYPATWAPGALTREELEKGQVMKLNAEFNVAGMWAHAHAATQPLAHYFSLASAAISEQTGSSAVELDRVPGFQIGTHAYHSGKKLDVAAMGFIVKERLISLTIAYDPASKDEHILEEEIAFMLSTWKWK